MTESSDSIGIAQADSGTRAVPPTFDGFLNLDLGIVGRTASTKSEANTSSTFNFWVSDRSELTGRIEIGTIVAARSDDGDDVTFGVVTEMRAYSDIDSFISDYLSHNFGSAELELPSDVSEVTVVTCAVMRNLSSKTKPVARSRVYFPNSHGIQFAYGLIDKAGTTIFQGAPIPVGVFENGDGTVAPVSVDEDFLLGPESAHLNVSGISGLASKTSAIEFILASLLKHSRKRVAVVMFNVKSRDLLYVDQPNQKLADDPWSTRAYSLLNIPAEPFKQAKFFAPRHPDNPTATQSTRQLPIEAFYWDLTQVYRDIPSLFSSMDWDDKMEGVWYAIQERFEQQTFTTYSQMLTWIDEQIQRTSGDWVSAGGHKATWAKMRSHLRRFPKSYEGLLATGGQGKDIPWTNIADKAIYVVDMHMLSDRGQRLVFSRSIRGINEILEEGNGPVDAVVVFVDELNKFAPSGSERTPLKSFLIDITARGRSSGLVLFGAQQFASSVDKEIVENSLTNLFGRTEANELRAPNYSSFTPEVKTKIMMLPQGQLLVKAPKFSQPIFVKFPYPPCLPGDQARFAQGAKPNGAGPV